MNIVRFFFTKEEEAAYISLLDLQRVMGRALRKSGVPVWYSQGFNPHIYMTFSLPLPLLQHSNVETMDCKTEAEPENLQIYLDTLNQALPKGIEIHKIAAPVHNASAISSAKYHIAYDTSSQLFEAALEQYNSCGQALVVRKTKRSEQQVDLKEFTKELKPLQQGHTAFAITLPAGSATHCNPALVTSFLASCGLDEAEATITRTGVFIQNGEEFR